MREQEEGRRERESEKESEKVREWWKSVENRKRDREEK